MILQAFRRLFKQDYPQQFQDLVDRLSTSLNIGIENLYTALNNNLSLKDNFYATVKQITLAVDSNGVPTSNVTMALSFTTPAIGITVINAINTTNASTYPTGGIFVVFQQTNGGLLFKKVTGLPTGNTFNLTVVAWG